MKPGQKYKHFKGMIVEIIAVATDSETMEEIVIYKHPDPIKGKEANTIWARPRKMFEETIEKDGKQIKRFELIN